jgi:hypothetical protein
MHERKAVFGLLRGCGWEESLDSGIKPSVNGTRKWREFEAKAHDDGSVSDGEDCGPCAGEQWMNVVIMENGSVEKAVLG